MLSIITPVRNGASYIRSCLEVVANQADEDIEHIIQDGNSTDRTLDIVREFAAGNPHVRWYSEADRGISDALNKGIGHARGNWIGILNVDDAYEPDTLIRARSIMDNLPEPAFLVGNCRVLDDKDHFKFLNRPKRLALKELLLGQRLAPHPVNPSAYFYHRSLHQRVGPYDVNNHHNMDLDFIFRMCQIARPHYVDEMWGNYRMGSQTTTVKDIRAGQSTRRRMAIYNLYSRNMPFHLRWRLALVRFITDTGPALLKDIIRRKFLSL